MHCVSPPAYDRVRARGSPPSPQMLHRVSQALGRSDLFSVFSLDSASGPLQAGAITVLM